MNEGPNIVKIAALIGDHARTSMLTALMSGQALTPTELATEANITKQTASSHLAKLEQAGLISVTKQGRHRYIKLAAPDVANLLETLMGIAQRTGATRLQAGPKDPALRRARVCYDHLAGELGVELYDSFLKQKLIRLAVDNAGEDESIALTSKGVHLLSKLNIDINGKPGSKRPVCRPCLDWSVRRYHLAGHLGVGLLNYCYERKWAYRQKDSRIVTFSSRGEAAFRELFI